MPYFIKKTTSNAYRCDCCKHDWSSVKQVDDRAEALSHISDKHYRNGEADIENVCIEIVDGSSGDVIAEGHLAWTGGRSSRYRNYHWYGWINGIQFDDIHGLKEGELTWSDIVTRVAKEETDQKIKQLEADVAAKLKEVEFFKSKQK